MNFPLDYLSRYLFIFKVLLEKLMTETAYTKIYDPVEDFKIIQSLFFFEVSMMKKKVFSEAICSLSRNSSGSNEFHEALCGLCLICYCFLISLIKTLLLLA